MIDAFHSVDLWEIIQSAMVWLKTFFNSPTGVQGIIEWLRLNFPTAAVVILQLCIFLIGIFLVGVIYYALKIYALHEEDDKLLFAEPPAEDRVETKTVVADYARDRWAKVIAHVNSENPGDWKLAILEADIILDEMLDKQGYHGDSIGDKMKKVEKSDFNTIENAWEAHKIRNQIAHEGSEFVITQREAKRVIDLFRSVFEEFYLI